MVWRSRDQVTLVLNKVVGGQDKPHQAQSLLPLNTTNSFGKLSLSLVPRIKHLVLSVVHIPTADMQP